MSGSRIRRIGQESTDSDGGTRHTDRKRRLDTRIDVAVNFSIPPLYRLRIRPYHRVDETEEVNNEDPPDKDECCPWPRGDFPVEVRRRDTYEEPDTTEDGEGIIRHTDLEMLEVDGPEASTPGDLFLSLVVCSFRLWEGRVARGVDDPLLCTYESKH